jgi:hypothetical protein
MEHQNPDQPDQTGHENKDVPCHDHVVSMAPGDTLFA